MKNHEQLKEICDKIGYENKNIEFKQNINSKKLILFKNGNIADVREIIFTQEFMDKLYEYVEYVEYEELLSFSEVWSGLVKNLDNPTEYLYNLIK